MDQEIDKGRDGCHCPAWVLACVHWDGRLLMLGDTTDYQSSCVRCESTPGPGVVLAVGEWGPCRVCGSPSLNMFQVEYASRFPDLPEAQAEFDRRAEELRQAP